MSKYFSATLSWGKSTGKVKSLSVAGVFSVVSYGVKVVNDESLFFNLQFGLRSVCLCELKIHWVLRKYLLSVDYNYQEFL